MIYLFTNAYPYGKSEESFLESEINYVSKSDIKIIIIPMSKRKDKRNTPDNIFICDKLASRSLWQNIFTFLIMVSSKNFWKLSFDKNRPKSFIEFMQAFKYLFGANLIKQFLLYNKAIFNEKGVLYSYWFNHTPLGLVLAKKTDLYFSDFSIITRAHGYDVYEKQVGIYFPYREYTLKNINAVYVVSQKGCNFMKNNYSQFKDIIYVSNLGVYPININKEKKPIIEPNSVNFVSCSSITPVKRVDFIFSCISDYANKCPDKTIFWTHIGGGQGFSELVLMVDRSNQQNLHVNLLGAINNQEVRELYNKNSFDIFINLSTSEGIPVSIMEAISAGIPVIATNVGGNKEIVNNKTGRLAPININQDLFNESVDYIIDNINYLRNSTLKFYYVKFNAEKNYKEFYNNIINI